MNVILRSIVFGLVVIGSCGCSAMMKHESSIPVVTDTQKLLAMEQQRDSWETGDGSARLKNMTAAEHLQQGEASLVSNDLTLAKLHLNLALAKDQNLEEAYLGLAEALFREGKVREGEAVLVKSLLSQGGHVRALARLGVISRAEGRPEEALKYLQRANELEPDSAWLLTELALTYEQLGQTRQAAGCLERSLQLLPGSAVALNNLGFNYLLQGRYSEAVPLLRKSLELAPGNRLAMNNLALACAFSDDQRTALQLFAASVGKAEAYNNLGYLLMLQQHPREAERALIQALELKPTYYARAKENLELLKSQSEDSQLFE